MRPERNKGFVLSMSGNKDAVQGGPPTPTIYLVPFAKLRTHCVVSQTGIEPGSLDSDRGVVCSIQGFFCSTQGVFWAKNAPNWARSKLSSQIDVLLRRFASKN